MFNASAKIIAFAISALSSFSIVGAQPRTGSLPAPTVKSTITLSGVPQQVAVNPFTNRIYVAIPSFTSAPDTLAVIDGKSDRIIKTIALPGNIGYVVAVDYFRNRIYVGGCFTDDKVKMCARARVLMDSLTR